MAFALAAEQERYREAVRAVCAKYPESYCRELDLKKRYPEEFLRALTDGGWLLVLIPYGMGGSA